jgi:uncharacterized protein YjbI with pentapeptide repeats
MTKPAASFAGTATNKQLLLADPVKLPALGTEVPLVSFFVLSPIFFVLLHFYVLLQTLLLGRTARAYDDALNRTLKKPEQNAIFRERLANTIFAQIFAGAPREREGWVGEVLRGNSWFTLVGSPILILLTFQFSFLPYHSHEVTWVHRALIFIEIVIVIALTMWPAVINPAKEFAWYRFDLRFWRASLWPWRMSEARQKYDLKEAWWRFVAAFQAARAKEQSPPSTEKKGDAKVLAYAIADRLKRFCGRLAAALRFALSMTQSRFFSQLAAVGVLAFSVFALSMPGEWHINLVTFRSLGSQACTRWIPGWLNLDKRIVVDRLVLKDVGIIDPDTFKKLQDDAPENVKMYNGARSKDLSGRDFICGEFEGVDFRRAALENSHFDGSLITRSRFDGARMTGAFLNGAFLNGANLNIVKLDQAHLRTAKLYDATLKDVDLTDADLAGVDLSEATLAGVTFKSGAKLSGANLSGLKTNDSVIDLSSAHLEGASFQYANLTKVSLAGAILDAADFYHAQLPANMPALPKSVLSSRPPDWDDQKAEQGKLANSVADTVCGPDLSDEQKAVLQDYRSEIVTGIITNALYPRKEDPACKPTKGTLTTASKLPTCPPEQPDTYRAILADRLSNCPVKVLSRDEAGYLRSGDFNGHFSKRP